MTEDKLIATLRNEIERAFSTQANEQAFLIIEGTDSEVRVLGHGGSFPAMKHLAYSVLVEVPNGALSSGQIDDMVVELETRVRTAPTFRLPDSSYLINRTWVFHEIDLRHNHAGTQLMVRVSHIATYLES